MKKVSVSFAFFVGYAVTSGLVVGQAPPVGAVELVGSRPLADATVLLQRLYGKVVTYEEASWDYAGDVEVPVGRDKSRKWSLQPKIQRFVMPAEAGTQPDLRLALSRTVEEYQQHTSGPRFRIIASSWGLHVLPSQVRDRNGSVSPAKSALDSEITIPSALRTPQEHFLALTAALTISYGIKIVPNLGAGGGFNNEFRARPTEFVWGVENMVARDALIDLLGRSATTFSWRLKCQPSTRDEDRMCALNLGMLEVAVHDVNNNPTTRVLRFDRCGDCPKNFPASGPRR